MTWVNGGNRDTILYKVVRQSLSVKMALGQIPAYIEEEAKQISGRRAFQAEGRTFKKKQQQP